MWDTLVLFSKLAAELVPTLLDLVVRYTRAVLHRRSYLPSDNPRNIVIIGASFAGYHAAKLLTDSIPSGYRVVIIEKHSHFHFTWAFPQFSVVPGHKHKSFVPYGPYLSSAPKGSYLFLKDTVREVQKNAVLLESGQTIDYAYLVIATGSKAGPPSRLDANEKDAGMGLLRELQSKIAASQHMVVLGGGAAGVELAADAKSFYPSKSVTLIHSRTRLLHTFGPKLHEAALKGLDKVKVDVLLNERLPVDADEENSIRLNSGQKIPCDLLVKCVGQKPASDIISALTPSSISNSGHISVQPTLQLSDPAFPNIYAAGDITDIKGNRNARVAMDQATVVADNIVNAIHGKDLVEFSRKWWYSGIQITLGLESSVTYLQDSTRECTISSNQKHLGMKSEKAWKFFGAKPFKDEVDVESLKSFKTV